ncbi:uncharacterized protein LOC129771171 [Toxorhynchites rutilus septentrionalis]|uniref:uncharacterized protein LOC129771171 n=1 Tax=Toxorhynchites rutilus septentrionalis TaxID=329112 RepID=UPI002479A0A0|nr:uncharacterized protein LOC129771171 [Toxorhynchites rutilus septentrionalis]
MLAIILILLFLSLPTMNVGQHVSIQKVDDLPLILVDKGQGRIRNDSNYYIHHFKIFPFIIHLIDLKAKFSDIEENQFTNLILKKFEEIEISLKNLIPIKRVKRWNTIGTIWKFIAGSPDANDLKIINDSINNLIVNNNAQVKINREVTFQMKEALFKTKEAINLFNSKSSELYSINIYLNLKYLHEKLYQISETIMLTKLGILNEKKKKLSVSEMKILLEDLNRENLTVLNIAEALTYATTSIASNEHEIALLIKLPKLIPTIFQKVLLVPTWNPKHQIHLPNNKYLIHDNDYYVVNSLLPNIYNKEELLLDNTTCVPNILKGKSASCDYVSNPIEDIVVIDNQHVLINLHGNFTLESSCGIPRRNLSGTYMVTFHNCEITINNRKFSNKVQNLTGNVILLPLNGIALEKGVTILNLSLEHLHKLHIETRRDLETIRLEANSLQWPHWSIFGGLSITPVIIGVIFLAYYLHTRKRNIIIQAEKPKSSCIDTNRLRDISLKDIIRTEPQL